MVPHPCLTLVGGRGGGLVGQATGLCGGRCSMVAVLVICMSWGGAWVLACCPSRHSGVTQMPDGGGAEGGEDLSRKGRMCCSCFLLRLDGG